MSHAQQISEQNIRSAHNRALTPDDGDDTPAVEPWRCAFCDTLHTDTPSCCDYNGKPCCSNLCLETLLQFNEAADVLEKAISQRNTAGILAAIFLVVIIVTLFGGRG